MRLWTALRTPVATARSLLQQEFARFRLRLNSAMPGQMEIGSGPVRKPGWVTVDLCTGVDVYWDLRRKLPFADASFDRVYSSHVLEHFTHKELKKLLREVLRVLRPDGQFLIAVPDASLYVEAYLKREDARNLLRYLPAVVSDRPMDYLNYIFYMDNQHKFMFDQDNLTHHCHQAGFVDCERREFDPQIDAAGRQYESLYMVCRRPHTA